MIYFSSMSLKEYIQSNYTELPRELLDLWGRTVVEIDELERKVATLEFVADDIRSEAEDLIKNIEEASVDYHNHRITAEDFVKAVTELAGEVNF